MMQQQSDFNFFGANTAPPASGPASDQHTTGSASAPPGMFGGTFAPMGAPQMSMPPAMPVYQQWGYNQNNNYPASLSQAAAPATNAAPKNSKSKKNSGAKDQIEQLQAQLEAERTAKAVVEARLKVRTEEVAAWKAGTNGIVTAAVQLQPLLQAGYIMPETTQQFNYFVYWAQMKVFEDTQKMQQLETERVAEAEENAKQEALEQRQKVAAAAKAAKQEEAARKAKEAAAARKAKAIAAAAKKQQECKAAQAREIRAAAQKSKEEAHAVHAAEAKASLPAYDPHAPPVVFGATGNTGHTSSRLDQFLSSAGINTSAGTAPETIANNTPVPAASEAVVAVAVAVAAVVAPPAPKTVQSAVKPVVKPVVKPKPTTWAGLVALTPTPTPTPEGSGSGSQNVPPATNAATPTAPSTSESESASENASTDRHKTTKAVVGNKNTQTQTKKFSPRDGQNQNQNQNRKGHLGGNNNSSRKPRFENSRGSNGNKNRSNRRTGNFKQQAKEASPQVTQYQADLEIARKLQANIDAYEHNGNPTEGEWQCQSKKGAAKVKRVIG